MPGCIGFLFARGLADFDIWYRSDGKSGLFIDHCIDLYLSACNRAVIAQRSYSWRCNEFICRGASCHGFFFIHLFYLAISYLSSCSAVASTGKLYFSELIVDVSL
jgi:hypothetical protein